ncbi:TM2 domain protein [mine drainage metagenome]|uniref:TM2 domain protein n=1 Tax=mine drainage metagenome TaxID=410659 RepID=A0A1J5QMB2_9ZZZZ
MSSDNDNLINRLPGASCMEHILQMRMNDVNSEIESWVSGIKGEQETANYLTQLDSQWHTLHSIPVGESGKDIDHLVLGPGGVYVINSKNHTGANALVSGPNIIIGRHPWPEPASALKDANHVAEILTAAVGFPVATTGVVSLVGVNKLTLGDEYPFATVLHAKGVTKLMRQPRTNQNLSQVQIEALYAAAAKSSTWGCAPQRDSQEIASQYRSLMMPAAPKSAPKTTNESKAPGSGVRTPAMSDRFVTERLRGLESQFSGTRGKLNTSSKSALLALLLLVFFGQFGLHRFYVGKRDHGLLTLCLLAIAFVSHPYFYVIFIWGFVDFVLLASGNYRDRLGRVLGVGTKQRHRRS